MQITVLQTLPLSSTDCFNILGEPGNQVNSNIFPWQIVYWKVKHIHIKLYRIKYNDFIPLLRNIESRVTFGLVLC